MKYILLPASVRGVQYRDVELIYMNDAEGLAPRRRLTAPTPKMEDIPPIYAYCALSPVFPRGGRGPLSTTQFENSAPSSTSRGTRMRAWVAEGSLGRRGIEIVNGMCWHVDQRYEQ